MKVLLVSLLAAIVSFNAFAYAIPGALEDQRVRRIVYDPNDVVRVIAQRGFATHIALDPNEHIEVAAPGDSEDWIVIARKGDHDIYIKPKLEAHDSNLDIRTDRRSYSFDLVVLPLKAKFGNDDEMYRVSFVYSASPAQTAGKQAASEVAPRLAASPVIRNLRYSMQAEPGSDDIEPVSASDDGRFTYVRIPANHEIPAVFRVQDDGSESLVDTHMDGDTIVVHEVAKRFVLRLGKEVVGLWNDAYDPDGVPPQNGTTAAGVARTLRGAHD